ncbi:MAG: hypothetical protein ACOYMW_06515 [Candidatus Competibacteraceae bacterium]
MSRHYRRALILSMGLAALLYPGVVLFADREAVLAAVGILSILIRTTGMNMAVLGHIVRADVDHDPVI